MSRSITPFMLAKEPAKATGWLGSYDHHLQRSVGSSPTMSNYQTNTFGGTQTFGFDGRPQDSDNDTDRGQ